MTPPIDGWLKAHHQVPEGEGLLACREAALTLRLEWPLWNQVKFEHNGVTAIFAVLFGSPFPGEDILGEARSRPDLYEARTRVHHQVLLAQAFLSRVEPLPELPDFMAPRSPSELRKVHASTRALIEAVRMGPVTPRVALPPSPLPGWTAPIGDPDKNLPAVMLRPANPGPAPDR